MIRNLEAAAAAIQEWMEYRAKQAGASVLVYGLSGGVDSALVALLCKRAHGASLGVMMPCHSSPSSLERARELVTKHNLQVVKVDLVGAYNAIHDQLAGAMTVPFRDTSVGGNASDGALRSCLRAPTLDYVAKLTNGIIVGTGNRDEDEMTRYFQKRGDGCVDISPIAKLHKSEVYQLARYLGCTDAILNATPSADLWGPDSGQADEKELGLTYAEVEWGIRELKDKGLRTRSISMADLLQYRKDMWDEEAELALRPYTTRERAILLTLADMDLKTKHKSEAPPVFDIRAIPGMVD